MNTVLHYLYLVCLFVSLPFLLPGIIRKIRAMAQKRKGPKLLQFYWDIQKVFLKADLKNPKSEAFSYLSGYFALYAGVLIWSLVLFEWGPLILIPFLLSIYRLSILGFAMEGGTSFGGMASSREMLLSVMAEPAFFLMILASQSHIEITDGIQGILIGVLFLGIAMLVLMAELTKPPFDDPRTHLELTMVHEGMLLEASGKTLGLFELASSIKLVSLLTFLIKLAIDHSKFFVFGSYELFWKDLVLFPVVIFLSLSIGLWEANSVRRNWNWIPEFMGLLFIALLVLGTLVKLA